MAWDEVAGLTVQWVAGYSGYMQLSFAFSQHFAVMFVVSSIPYFSELNATLFLIHYGVEPSDIDFF